MNSIPYCLLLPIVLISSQVSLADYSNLPVSSNTNASVFVAIHGLQGYSGVYGLAAGESSARLMLEISNEFHQKVAATERVELDYERTTLRLDYTRGLGERLSAGIQIPFIINSGGILDGPIENWHDLFGLPQGGRDNTDRHELLIAYSGNNQSIQITDSDQGIGDISIYADRPVFESSARKFKVRAKLKLPTADHEQLFGSGGYAFSLHLNLATNLYENVFTYASAGLSYLTQGDVLAQQQNDLIAAATMGIGWQFKPAVMLSAQLDLNSEIYNNTDLDAISGEAGIIYVSAKYSLSKQTSLQLGFTEDVLNKDAGPDFGLRIGFRF